MSLERDANPKARPGNNPQDGEPRSEIIPEPEAAVQPKTVVRLGPGTRTECEQEVICEVPITLFVNEKQIVTLMSIPHELSALAVGFLFSEGWITNRDEIEGVQEEEETGVVRVRLKAFPPLADRFWEKRIIGSGCGKATSFYNVLDAMQCKPVSSEFQVSSSDALAWMKTTLQRAPLYRRTRGVHAVSLHGKSGLILFEQDIGRHNALDRILGKCLLRGIPTEETALLTTGRLSSEMIVKAARVGVPILFSRSSTTTLAISLAERLNMTLLGRMQAGGMSIYTHPHRILTDG
jgi:FdhD protein